MAEQTGSAMGGEARWPEPAGGGGGGEAPVGADAVAAAAGKAARTQDRRDLAAYLRLRRRKR